MCSEFPIELFVALRAALLDRVILPHGRLWADAEEGWWADFRARLDASQLGPRAEPEDVRDAIRLLKLRGVPELGSFERPFLRALRDAIVAREAEGTARPRPPGPRLGAAWRAWKALGRGERERRLAGSPFPGFAQMSLRRRVAFLAGQLAEAPAAPRGARPGAPRPPARRLPGPERIVAGPDGRRLAEFDRPEGPPARLPWDDPPAGIGAESA